MRIRCCEAENVSACRNNSLKQEIPKLSVVTGSVVALAVHVDTETCRIFFENVCKLINYILELNIIRVIGLVIVGNISCSAVLARVIDYAESAELINILNRGFVVTCAADCVVTVINKP